MLGERKNVSPRVGGHAHKATPYMMHIRRLQSVSKVKSSFGRHIAAILKNVILAIRRIILAMWQFGEKIWRKFGV